MTTALASTEGRRHDLQPGTPRPYCELPPGTWKRVRAVRPAREWLPFVHALIDAGGLDALRRGVYSRAFLHRLIDELARHADFTTGRDCMPGHAALGAALARTPRTVSRRTPKQGEKRTPAEAAVSDNSRHARGAIGTVLVPAGLLARVVQGHHLNGVERLEQWANGSARRDARSVYGLTLPRAARPARPAADRPVDNRPPANAGPRTTFRSPTGNKVMTRSSGLAVVSKGQLPSNEACAQVDNRHGRLTADKTLSADAARRPAPTNRRVWEPNPGLYAFALALRHALPGQLGYERPLKLCATIKRFWQLGWDADSLVADLHLVYQRLGKPFITHRPHHPARWLGWALQHVDTTTTPPQRRLDAHAEAADNEICPHGITGGARHNIVIHGPRCPLCRNQ